MRRVLFRNLSLYSRHLLHPSPSPSPSLSRSLSLCPNPKPSVPFSCSTLSSRFCSSSSSSDKESQVDSGTHTQELGEDAGKQGDGDDRDLDETDHELTDRLLKLRNEEALDLIDRIESKSESLPEEVDEDKEDDEFDLGLDEVETDTEIDDLYDTKSIVVERFQEGFLKMDDTKWDDMIKELTGEGYSEAVQQCQEILEDMQHYDKLLPDEIKTKVKEKFEELGARCERGELKPDEAYELFAKFEDEMVSEYMKTTEAEGPPESDKIVVPYKNMSTNEPPGEGPILRWQTRVVFSPGTNAWHPKNRKVKLSVTVKELGLSKHQFRRLRSLVGKRYDAGRDELTITSERFEHREENRKDCLRTLLSLIEEAAKANELVEDARASYVKERLKANPAFMEKLNAKITRLQGQKTAPAAVGSA